MLWSFVVFDNYTNAFCFYLFSDTHISNKQTEVKTKDIQKNIKEIEVSKNCDLHLYNLKICLNGCCHSVPTDISACKMVWTDAFILLKRKKNVWRPPNVIIHIPF